MKRLSLYLIVWFIWIQYSFSLLWCEEEDSIVCHDEKNFKNQCKQIHFSVDGNKLIFKNKKVMEKMKIVCSIDHNYQYLAEKNTMLKNEIDLQRNQKVKDSFHFKTLFSKFFENNSTLKGISCNPGHYLSDGICKECDPGHYQYHSGKTECDVCGEGDAGTGG